MIIFYAFALIYLVWRLYSIINKGKFWGQDINCIICFFVIIFVNALVEGMVARLVLDLLLYFACYFALKGFTEKKAKEVKENK